MYTITLKNPIRVDGDMKSVLEFKFARPDSSERLLVCSNNECDISLRSYFPLENVLGAYSDGKDESK